MALIQSCDQLLSPGAPSSTNGQPPVVSPRRKDVDSTHVTGDSMSELGSIHDSYFGSSRESLVMEEEEEEEMPNLLDTTADSITEGPPLLAATDVEVDEKEMEVRGGEGWGGRGESGDEGEGELCEGSDRMR